MDGERVRILVVDDHPMVREGVIARLSSEDNVEVVGEVAEAQALSEAVARLQPDLVLMDVRIRHDDGIELTRRLSAEYPEVRVLMLSMFGNPELVHRALQAGAAGWVMKDAPTSDLLEGIAEVVAGGTYFSETLRGRQFRSQNWRPKVSFRESQILSQLAEGRSSKHISDALGMSPRTVETHRRNIMRKLHIVSKAALVKYAVENCGSSLGPRTADT